MPRNEDRSGVFPDIFNPFDLFDIVADFGFDDFGGLLGILGIGLVVFLCCAVVWKLIDIFSN